MPNLPSAAPHLTWTMEPAVIAAAAVATVLFVRAFAELRRRGRTDHAPWSRLVFFAGGIAAGVLPLVSPLDAIADRYLLCAHMLEHVLIGDAAPALLLLALRGPLLYFLLPAPVLAPVARLKPLKRLLGVVLRPWVSVLLWAIAYGAWHIPAAYDYTLTHGTVHDTEHACFFAGGLLIWTQLIDPDRRGRLTVAGRLTLAAVVFGLGTLLSDVLVFSLHPLYASYAAQPDRLLGLSPLEDQRLAGLVMIAEQLVSLGTCFFVLLRPSLRRAHQPAGRIRERTA